jgi:hypothetical protein
MIKTYISKKIQINNIFDRLKDIKVNSLLDSNSMDFIKHNKKVFSSSTKNDLKKPLVLMELNETVTNTIAYSYLANQLSKKYNAKLVAFFPRIPRTFSKKIIWLLRSTFGSPIYSVFQSFGVNTFVVPSKSKKLLQESNNLYEKKLFEIKSKEDLENLTINNIRFGDLIFDYFLNFHKQQTVDINSKLFRLHLKYCLQLIVYWNNFFHNNNIVAINVSHTVYTNAIPLRIAAKQGIKCFQCNESHVYQLTNNKLFAYADFKNYKESFKELEDDQKKLGLKLAKERIDLRFSGHVGVDMAYSSKSAFSSPSSKKLLRKSNKIKILLAPHCFFDSPHPYGLNLFPDVIAWLEEIVRISSLTDYDWYVKTHPDFLEKTKILVEDFFRPHENFTLLPSNSSHIQLVDEGIDFALTMWGTIGFEYAAMKIPVLNASLNNPHIGYDFNIHPKTKNEFTNILMNLQDVKLDINVNEVYEYYYMKHLHYNHNWLFNDFEDLVNKFNSSKGRLTPDVYKYWIKQWTLERHNEILNNLNNFIDSDDYRLTS